MRELGIRQLINQIYFQNVFYMGKPICGKWSDICLLWAKAYWDPRECIWSTQSVCFCTSSHFMFFVLSMTPPSHRQAGRFFFFFFWISSNTSICILNMSRKMASVSAAVTVFGRQAGGCLFMWHRQNIPRCRYHRAACVTRYCSTNGCHGKKPESGCHF